MIKMVQTKSTYYRLLPACSMNYTPRTYARFNKSNFIYQRNGGPLHLPFRNQLQCYSYSDGGTEVNGIGLQQNTITFSFNTIIILLLKQERKGLIFKKKVLSCKLDQSKI